MYKIKAKYTTREGIIIIKYKVEWRNEINMEMMAITKYIYEKEKVDKVYFLLINTIP